jgi:hemerythrin HHE cation binding domain-containing protein
METRDNAARPDEYRFIHKALRLFMADTLAVVGRLDPADPSDVIDAVKQVQDLLAFCRSHLKHENAFLHPSMEARAPGSSARIANEHVHHDETIDNLAMDAAALEAGSSGPARMVAADALYSKLALFIGENFVHMHTEETENNAVIWATHSDQDILAIHRAVMAALTPDEMARGARWMIAALNPPQRAAFLSEIRQSAPLPVFEGLLDLAKAHLSDLEWRKLAQAMTQRAAA